MSYKVINNVYIIVLMCGTTSVVIYLTSTTTKVKVHKWIKKGGGAVPTYGNNSFGF